MIIWFYSFVCILPNKLNKKVYTMYKASSVTFHRWIKFLLSMMEEVRKKNSILEFVSAWFYITHSFIQVCLHIHQTSLRIYYFILFYIFVLYIGTCEWKKWLEPIQTYRKTVIEKQHFKIMPGIFMYDCDISSDIVKQMWCFCS